MAGNIYAGGADTSGTSVGRRGRGNRGGNGGGGGNSRNRGGGGGGGGGKTPKGGLYGGKAGEAAANMDPEAYLRSFFTKAGLINGTGTEFDNYMNDVGIQNALRQYQTAVAGNQRLSIEDWMSKTYGGAGFNGKRGTDFRAGAWGASPGDSGGTTPGGGIYSGSAPSPGTTPVGGGGTGGGGWRGNLGAPPWGPGGGGGGGNSPFDDAHHAMANANPLQYAHTEGARNDLIAANGNDQFQQWYDQTYAPQLQGQFATASRANPQLNFDDFLASQDLAGNARRAYANRPPSQRGMTQESPAGRWSWWA